MKKLRVLVADDNRDAVILLASLMEIYGHEVREAFDGPSALMAIHEFHPHLILLDIGMPGMDGFEVAQKIRERPDLDRMVIAVVSGYGTDEDKEMSKEYGIDFHLVKPAAIGEFKQILESVATGRKVRAFKTPRKIPIWQQFSNRN